MAATKNVGAALPLEFADASGVADDDKVAILVAHQVATETAALTQEIEALKAEIATLKTDNAGLKDKAEVAETAKVAAEKAFADFQTKLADEAETAKLGEARKSEIAKVAPALLEGEKEKLAERVERWAAMDEAAFAAHLADLASVAGTTSDESLETAMKRGTKTPFTGTSAAAVVLGLN